MTGTGSDRLDGCKEIAAYIFLRMGRTYSERTIQEFISDRRDDPMPVQKFGKGVSITKRALDEWIERQWKDRRPRSVRYQ